MATKRRAERHPAKRPVPPSPSRKWPLAGAALVVLAAGAAGVLYSRGFFKPAVKSPVSVLLITLDTARADHLGAYGHLAARTPNLDALARDGVRFADAVTAAPITGPAHAAILTGRYPGRLGVRDNATTPLPESALTLAEVLAKQDYATGAFVGAFVLDRPYGFAQGFGAFESGFTRVDSGAEANAERRGDAVVDDALRWLSSLPADRRFFAWVHLYDPHAPYAAPEPFRSEFTARPYDGELAFVDQQVGRLMDALGGRKVLDRTLVVAIGDHGEGLGEHGEDEHGVFLYESVLRIPWMMAGPGVARGKAVTEQVRSIDLFPTVLEALNIERPQPLDGESLVALLKGGTRSSVPAAYAETEYPRLHFGWSELRSVRADGWKAIDAPRAELYKLGTDPAEAHNLYETERALGDRMVSEAARMGKDIGGANPAAVKQPDRETLERLRSLGYVGVSAALPSGTRGPDPKDTVQQRREYKALISQAIDDLREGRAAVAIDKLQRLVKINDRAYDLHALLGEAYQKTGKLDAALGEYEFAALLNKDAAMPRLSAAEVQLARGDVAGAGRQVDEAARIDPGSFDVALVMGRVLEREEKAAEALAAYDKAAALNPANPRPHTLAVNLAMRLRSYDIAERHLRVLLEMGYERARTEEALARIAARRGGARR